MNKIFIDVNCVEKVKYWDNAVKDMVTDCETFIRSINVDHIVFIGNDGILTTVGHISTSDSREDIMNKLVEAGRHYE